MIYLRGYLGTLNLGDAIQTLALNALLPEAKIWHGNDNPDGLFVVNGWLGRKPYWTTQRTIFAGVFLSPLTPPHYDWAAASAYAPIGARDPFTLQAKPRKMPL